MKKNSKLTKPVLQFAPTTYTIAVWARASLFRRFTDTNVYGTGSVKIRKTRHEISVVIRIFIIV